MKERISIIKLENVFGINEVNISPEQITEIIGKTGSGKTSILDSLKLLLTNKGARTRYIRNGESEADLFIKTSSGLEVSRIKKREGTDKINITKNGSKIDDTPQAFLNRLFSDEQFNPLKFVEMTETEQKKVLLSVLEIEWTENDFLNWFEEIPKEVNSEKHILEILEKLSGDKSEWYEKREELGRVIRATKAVRDDHFKTIPEKYNPDDWRNLSLVEKSMEIQKKNEINAQRKKCEEYLKTYPEKIEAIENKFSLKVKEQQEKKDSKIEAVENKIKVKEKSILENIENMQNEIKQLEEKIKDLNYEIENSKNRIELLHETDLKIEIDGIVKEHAVIINSIEEANKVELEKYEKYRKESQDYLENTIEENIEKMVEEVQYSEKMKLHITSWDKAIEKDGEISILQEKYQAYTEKIELARKLPAILIEKSDLPVKGLKLINGNIEIENSHGEYMLIDGLSDGEKMQLAIKIAALKSKELGVVFCDGTEKLDEETYRFFISECSKTGLQFFFTRTTDGNFEVKTYNFQTK